MAAAQPAAYPIGSPVRTPRQDPCSSADRRTLTSLLRDDPVASWSCGWWPNWLRGHRRTWSTGYAPRSPSTWY